MFGRKFCLLTTALIAGGLATAAYAANVKPAVIYDLGGKFDKSFNEGVFNGATKFALWRLGGNDPDSLRMLSDFLVS